MINSGLSAPEVQGQKRVGVGRRGINNIGDSAFFPSFKDFPLFSGRRLEEEVSQEKGAGRRDGKRWRGKKKGW